VPFHAMYIASEKWVKKNRFEKGRLLNYFWINNMDMKRHMLICFFMQVDGRNEWGS
jgi:hypothetical protein